MLTKDLKESRVMRNFAVALLLITFAGIALAALGPTDGGELAAVQPERVALGDVAPDFRLKRSDNSMVALSQYRDKQHVVLVFYRGHW